MGGHCRNKPVRRLWLQPRGRAHRAGQGRHQRAVKVWDKREFRNLDDTVELGTRNIKVALRRLPQMGPRRGAEELDLDGTIRARPKHGLA